MQGGDGYPDTTLLSFIADYFSISLDELIKIDELRNESVPLFFSILKNY